MLAWDDEKIERVMERLQQTFFERFPIYADLEREIMPASLPNFYSALQLAEQTRVTLLSLLKDLRTRRSQAMTS